MMSAFDDLAQEVLHVIVALCDAPSRRQLKATSRACYFAVCDVANTTDSTMHVRAGVDATTMHHAICSRRRLRLHATGDPMQWCCMGDSTVMRDVHWTVSSTPMFMPPALPIRAQCALPHTLQRLELDMYAPIGSFVIKSLCLSLPGAKALTHLSLRPIGTPDLIHVLNALARRACDNFATPLRSLYVDLYGVHASARQSVVNVSGLAHVHKFFLCMQADTPAIDAIDAQRITESFLCMTRTPLTHFAYFNPPLRVADALALSIRRSCDTLTHLVVPVLLATDAHDIEAAIDETNVLEELVIHWHAVHLDFVLSHKQNLRVLTHYGTISSGWQLMMQLAQLRNIETCYISMPMTDEFVHMICQHVYWPNAQKIYLGQLIAEGSQWWSMLRSPCAQ